MPDKDRYPTEEELNIVKNWDCKDPKGLVDYIESIWWMADWGFKLTGKKVLKLELHTGGWSGNEDIIDALQNTFLWWLYWEKSVRGGHYYFVIRPVKKAKH